MANTCAPGVSVCMYSSRCTVSIDNNLSVLGSYKCRAGWASHESPCLVFKNIVARPKAKKNVVCFHDNLCDNFMIIFFCHK